MRPLALSNRPKVCLGLAKTVTSTHTPSCELLLATSVGCFQWLTPLARLHCGLPHARLARPTSPLGCHHWLTQPPLCLLPRPTHIRRNFPGFGLLVLHDASKLKAVINIVYPYYELVVVRSKCNRLVFQTKPAVPSGKFASKVHTILTPHTHDTHP